MASTFVSVPKPFFSLPLRTNAPSPPSQINLGFRRITLRINAVSTKWEPAKVVPQADRVLLRLEVLPEVVSVWSDVGEVEPDKKVLFSVISAYEVNLGTDAKRCFCKEGDLLAIVQ